MESIHKLDQLIRDYYLPIIREAIKEHEEYCKTHPEVAAFLASMPNGYWRKGVLAGELPEHPEREQANQEGVSS